MKLRQAGPTFTAHSALALVPIVANAVHRQLKKLAERVASPRKDSVRDSFPTFTAPALLCGIHRTAQPRILLARFKRMPSFTPECWATYRQNPSLSNYRKLYKADRELSMYVGLTETESRFSEQHIVRRVTRERFLNRIEPGSWGRTIWIHPEKDGVEDVGFHLLLVLLQEGVIRETDSVTSQALAYIKQRFPKYEANEVWFELKRRFAEPEGWRALESYLKRLHSVKVRAEGGQVISSGRYPSYISACLRLKRNKPILKQYDSIPEAVALIAREVSSLSKDSLYDWIKAGKIPVHREFGQMWLDEDGFHLAKHLAVDRFLRWEIKKRLIDRGRSPEAAKKYVYRARKAGKSFKDIAKGLHLRSIQGR